MLVLRTSNFQGAAIRPIVSRQTLYCLSHVIFEFRNLAAMLFNSFEKFLKTSGVLV